uniref:Uncharacterized protein n=1 Tax=Arundo donax TaxID=35708 RepID=A0A0A9AZG4_ARUDO
MYHYLGILHSVRSVGGGCWLATQGHQT